MSETTAELRANHLADGSRCMECRDELGAVYAAVDRGEWLSAHCVQCAEELIALEAFGELSRREAAGE